MNEFGIQGRPIGAGHPPYVIAELSGNHNGDIARAFELIDACAAAGADAVKLQTYTADTITIDHDGPGFVIQGGLWNGRRLHELYQEAHTPWDWHPALFERAAAHGVHCFSSPFDGTAVDFLENLRPPAYKIASFEIVDLPLIRKASATGKPLIISTGMASDEEIAEAISAACGAGAGGVALLHCVSGYPTPVEDINLARIKWLAEKHGCITGLSDHTLGPWVPIAAVACGAAIIEKHVTLRRADGGPDAAFSLEPEELKLLVEGVRVAQRALGSAQYGRTGSEAGNAVFRRSIYVVKDVKAGEVFSEMNLRSIRPGHGLAPKYLQDVLGKHAARNILRGTPMSLDLVGKE
jgi:pseudaminic acid synthase